MPSTAVRLLISQEPTPTERSAATFPPPAARGRRLMVGATTGLVVTGLLVCLIMTM
ncbi:hypothetical protein [Streptomyces phaeochromogenes]|uniref:hypothetical protein n=1 Tax=Streptomyces phaeochromogenes TaxID=1923 RepID=UPI000AAD2FF8|nr:hypothetical protein [Streptomyces phaeochromogenes]